MKFPCPNCGVSTFRFRDKALVGRWTKKVCKKCGKSVGLHPAWVALTGTLGSILPVIVALVALAESSWLVFWIGIALFAIIVVVALIAAPLALKE